MPGWNAWHVGTNEVHDIFHSVNYLLLTATFAVVSLAVCYVVVFFILGFDLSNTA